MDFNYSEEQEAVRQLAGQIFGDRSTHERLKQVEAEAGDDGPSTASSGRSWPGPACSASTWARTSEVPGSTSSQHAWSSRRRAGLRPTSRSSRRWSTAPAPRPFRHRCPAQDLALGRGQRRDDPHRRHGGAGRRGDPPGGSEPATTATAQADGSWVLSGTKACVPAALVADAVLVPATCRTADGASAGAGVFIVEPGADGVTLTRQTTTTGRPEAIMQLATCASVRTGWWGRAPTVRP